MQIARKSSTAAPASYAVLWRRGDRGAPYAGGLELHEQHLRLEGGSRNGSEITVDIPYRDIVSARIGRAARERLDGRPALVIEARDDSILLVTSSVGLGMIHEMAELLEARLSEGLAV